MTTIYPRRISLLPAGFTARNQGPGNKCQSYTIGNAGRILRERAGVVDIGEPTEDAIYYDATKRVQGLAGDPGASFWHLQTSLARYGLPTVPWSDGGDLREANQPPQSVVASGLANKPTVFEMVPYIRSGPGKDSVHETLAMLLADGKPVPITMLLSTNFWGLGPHWDYTQCRYVYNPAEHRGEHAALVVGRDMDAGVYAVLNSWGPGWGAYGVFAITFEEFARCVTQHWHLASSPYPLVKEFSVMSNPVPTSLTADQQAAADLRIKAALAAAYTRDADGDGQADTWTGALQRAGELLLSDKQFERYAGLPRFTVRDYTNRGAITAPAGLAFDLEP